MPTVYKINFEHDPHHEPQLSLYNDMDYVRDKYYKIKDRYKILSLEPLNIELDEIYKIHAHKWSPPNILIITKNRDKFWFCDITRKEFSKVFFPRDPFFKHFMRRMSIRRGYFNGYGFPTLKDPISAGKYPALAKAIEELLERDRIEEGKKNEKERKSDS